MSAAADCPAAGLWCGRNGGPVGRHGPCPEHGWACPVRLAAAHERAAAGLTLAGHNPPGWRPADERDPFDTAADAAGIDADGGPVAAGRGFGAPTAAAVRASFRGGFDGLAL